MLFTLLYFEEFRASLAKLLMAILGLAAMVSFVIVIIHIIKGDKEGAIKLIKWFAAFIVGFILLDILAASNMKIYDSNQIEADTNRTDTENVIEDLFD